MEHTTGFRRSHFCFHRIVAVLLHIYRIFHPLSILGRRQRAGSVIVRHTRQSIVIFCSIDSTWELRNDVIVRRTFCTSCYLEIAIALVDGTVCCSYHCLCITITNLSGRVIYNVRLLGHRLHQFVVDIEINLLDGLGGQTCTDLDGHHIVLGHLQGSRTDIDGSLFLRAGEGTHGVLGGIGLHVLLDPRHGRALFAVLVKARVTNPSSTMDIAPQGDTGTIGLLPHHRQQLLVLSLLLGIVGNVNI